MAIRILTHKGTDNTNIDGARDNHFNAGMRSGIVKGTYNEGKLFASESNILTLDTCELRICGHRIVIDEPISITFSTPPVTATRYYAIAKISMESTKFNPSFSFEIKNANEKLRQMNFYNVPNSLGHVYELELGRFTLTTNGTIDDLIETAELITGGTGSGGTGIIVGNVEVETLKAGAPAEVITTNRFNPETGQTEVDFIFGIPQGEAGEKGEAGKDVNVNEFAKEFTAGFSQSEVSDKTEFVSQTSPLAQRQRACCYGNGYYVIAGTGGELAYSQDGVNWTKITAFTSDVITGLAYGNGYFVAVDSGGKIFRTDIPENVWSNVSSFEGNVIIESVRYINNQFVACGHYGYILRSTNGENWDILHEFEDKTTDKKFIDIGYGDGKFVAVGGDGMIYTSINGEIWYDHTSATVTTDIRAIMYANGQFVIGTSGGIIAYSKDGINWQLANNPSSLTISWIRNFTYFDNRLYVVMYASNGQGEIWLSKDKGITWEVAQTVAGRLWCVSCGNDKFFASGDNGAIYLLDLELNWTTSTPNTNYIWYRFKVLQNDGSVIYSDIYNDKIPKISYDETTNTLNIITE